MREQIKINDKKPLSTKENSAFNNRKTGFRSQSSHVDRILLLQRTIGNQAVQRLIKSGVLQAKLRVGQSGDKYEQEADRVADAVMRIPEPRTVSQRDLHIQQLCQGCEEEDLRRKPEEEELLQTKEISGQNAENTPDLESRINAIRGGGQPLAKSELAFFEPRFGHDFSQVRLHTDTQAVESAQALNAQAFTMGSDVVFGVGKYSPGTREGQSLLAHELTHVVQQRGGLSSIKNGDPSLDETIHSTSHFLIQRITNPLSGMSTFQSPGSSGWRGAIWGCYRNNCNKKHKGWDIHASVGTECKAAVAGKISRHSEIAGYGNYIILTSTADATKKYYYTHLSSREPAGIVAEGDKVGKTGVTGNASSSRQHLHFTVKEGGNKVDPDGKGFTKPTKVVETTGSTAMTINFVETDPCNPCSM